MREVEVLEVEVASLLWMISILEWKNDRKLLHFSGLNEDEMFSWGLIMVEKRVRGLEDTE